MGIIVYISVHSGNQKIEMAQQKIVMVMNNRKVEFSIINISAPGMQEQRKFMRERGRKREGERNVLPPQIFNGKEYRGDFEQFDIANEDDVLEEFLGIPRKHRKIESVNMGRVAEDVGTLNAGKLELNKNVAEEQQTQIDNTEEDLNLGGELETKDETTEWSDMFSVLDHIEEGCLSDIDIHEDETSDRIIKTGKDQEEEDTFSDEEFFCISVFIDEVLEAEGRTNDTVIELAKYVEEPFNYCDNLMLKRIIPRIKFAQKERQDNTEVIPEANGIDTNDDESTDESCDESEDGYMSDGELMRKNSRGFKQLVNCKKFWKASLMMGQP